MNDINWVEIIIKMLLFLSASYFIFYKSWLKALGNEVAKLSTREQLTELEEKVKKDFNEKLESYKNKLQEELAHKIEPLKSDLAKNNITHEIQFGVLHQERTKITIELYKKLQEVHSAMVIWTAFMHPIIENAEKESLERTDRVNKAMDDFRNFYIVNKIYFSLSFCKTIDSVFQDYWDKAWEYNYKQQRIQSGQLNKDFYIEFSKEMSKISKDIREHLPKKIEEIEIKLRKILNVEDEE